MLRSDWEYLTRQLVGPDTTKDPVQVRLNAAPPMVRQQATFVGHSRPLYGR